MREWEQVQTLQRPRCVTLAKSPNLSGPQHLHHGYNTDSELLYTSKQVLKTAFEGKQSWVPR